MASTTWQRPWWLSFLDHTNITVTGLTAAAVLFTRSAGVAYFAAGALACSLSVKVLKRAIRQPRPKKKKGKEKKTYGMPSTHSATIAYYAAFISLACAYLPLHPRLPGGEALLRPGVPVLVIPWATLIALSRLWLGHHTIPQVVVGVLYGFAFTGTWYTVWVGGLNEYGKMVEEYVDVWLQ